ncbi:MAG: alpha/beta fold hydrolase [Solirubrobacterales bacterium]|nr:alpha/beta fold hydrolase [Solirubrobacterales bacterium]
MRRRSPAVAILAVAALAGCGSHGRASNATPPPRPHLTNAHACSGIRGFKCAVLTVPLDHAGQARGTLQLAVGFETTSDAPRGVLLFLSGGPGQPGIRFIPRIRSWLGAAFAGYRLVMFDQRGTGAGALRCPALQASAGSSDLTVPPPGAVAACAREVGPSRRYFTTAETVADIESLRIALGVSRLTLDGVSYGTFVAERYALRYPGRVTRLVLDSVVPQQGVDPFYLAGLEATARVLRSACAEQRCPWDPAQDLAGVVRARHNGPALLDALVAESIVFPSFPGIPALLHAAREGDVKALDMFLEAVQRGEATPADALSQGLHESTLCLDLRAPWNPQAAPSQRAETLARAIAAMPASALFPFDRATAAGNGMARACLEWPPTTPPALDTGSPAGPLSPPALLFAGERDLSTPLAWAREEAAHAARGRLIIVPRTGHSVQLRARDPSVRRILARFLQG